MGERRLLVLLVNFVGERSQPISPEEARQLFLDGPDSLAAFFREVSYGNLRFTGEVRGWVELPIPCSEREDIVNAAIETAAAAGPLAGFDDLLVYYPFVLGCPAGRPSASGVRQDFASGEGPLAMTVAGVPHGYPPGVAWHEMGHNFGLGHAGRMTCPNGVIDESCTFLPYGDGSDVLGDMRGHLSAYRKEWLGWLTVPRATPNACVELHAIEQPTDGIRALKFPAGRAGGCPAWIYVEHREPIGFDAFLAPSVTRGVLVRRADECRTMSDLLVVANVTGSFGEVTAGSPAFLDGPDPLLLNVEAVDDGRAVVCLRRFGLFSSRVHFAEPGAAAADRFVASGRLGLPGLDPPEALPDGSWTIRLSWVDGGVPAPFYEGSLPALACPSRRVCSGAAADRGLVLALRRTSEEGTWKFRMTGRAALGDAPSGEAVVRVEVCPPHDLGSCLAGNFRFRPDGTRLRYP